MINISVKALGSRHTRILITPFHFVLGDIYGNIYVISLLYSPLIPFDGYL
jgi:hypothetical protein